MSVPEHWWLGHTAQNLHQGKLSTFLEDSNLWLLELDDINEEHLYPII